MTFDRNSIPGDKLSSSPPPPLSTRVEFSIENGNVATRPAGSAVLNPRQMLSAPVHSRTLHCAEIRPRRDLLRDVDFSSMNAGECARAANWTSFDSHERREKSIFFIAKNAFCCRGRFIAHVELSGYIKRVPLKLSCESWARWRRVIDELCWYFAANE